MLEIQDRREFGKSVQANVEIKSLGCAGWIVTFCVFEWRGWKDGAIDYSSAGTSIIISNFGEALCRFYDFVAMAQVVSR